MPIEFQCTRCREMIRVPDGTEGKRTRCPQCQDIQTVSGDSFVVATATGRAKNLEPLGSENPFQDKPESEATYESPYESPTESLGSSAPPQSSGQIRAAAQARLQMPVMICQVMMVLMLLMIVISAGFMLIMVAGLTHQAGAAVGPLFAIMIGLVIFIEGGVIVIGLYGLGHAANVGNHVWAWVGLIICAIIGSNCMLLLPFAIWGMVVLADADVKKAFRK